MLKTLKQAISIATIVLLLTTQSVAVYAEAQPAIEAQEAQEASDQPAPEPEPQTQQSQPTPPPSEQPSASPQVTPAPTVTEAQPAIEAQAASNNNEAEDAERERLRKERVEQARLAVALASSESSSPPSLLGPYSGDTSNANIGDVSIETGDVNNVANLTSNANSNLGTLGCCESPSAVVGNSNNGADSTNDTSASIATSNNTIQDNQAAVVNELDQSAYTGGNKAEDNMGDVTITTGDANVTGTVITAVNTNVAGVVVSEFNILDDQTGDVILDLGTGCISNCSVGGDTLVGNFGNGENSTNNTNLDSSANNNTIQTNDALIESGLNLVADTGYNSASYNGKGDAVITTGDANVAANVLTFANNNIAGNVAYAVVNIFGDLVGDIILPESAFESICGTCGVTSTYASNSNNLAGSDNNLNLDQTTNNNTFQNNDADIANNLYFEANTGDNSSSYNGGSGNSSIKTGEANVDTNVLNVVNSNLASGDMWLVIINEAGNWIGRLIGAPTGTNFAGSDGIEFQVDEATGNITATNNGNGANSTNNTSVSQTTNNNLTQTNNAKLLNNLNLAANTGHNKANDNIGGNSTIETGDASIIANLVNFVNNNIAGGRLLVTIVNVFGSWKGDFITPGQQKQVGSQNQTQQVAQENNNQGEPNSQPTPQSTNQPTSNPTITNTQNPQNSEVLAAAFGVLGNIDFNPFVKFVNKDKENIPSHSLIGGQKALNKNKIRINLAWLMLVLPAVLGFVTYKNRTRLQSLLSRKRII